MAQPLMESNIKPPPPPAPPPTTIFNIHKKLTKDGIFKADPTGLSIPCSKAKTSSGNFEALYLMNTIRVSMLCLN
jgi:hypothetical protein